MPNPDPASLDPPVRWRTTDIDVLTTVVDALRLRGRAFCRSEVRAPWGLRVPAGPLAHFHLVERGRCWLRIGTRAKPIELGARDLIVLPHGELHVISDPMPPPARSIFDFGPLDDRSGHVIKNKGAGAGCRIICGAFRFDRPDAHPLLGLLPRLIHLRGDDRTPDVLAPILRVLGEESRRPGPGTETIVSRLTDVIFVQALRRWLRDLPEGAGGWLGALRDRHVSVALGLIHRRPERPWTVAALAAEAGLSRAPFAARFKALVGEAPLTYLARWRMATAARWLEEEGLATAAVAERIGYESLSAFSKAFKRSFGVPPAAYRRRAVTPGGHASIRG